ncbi:MAG: hypothetical protein WDZ34_00260 [Candidatus Saccharimonadales bacterium]
MRRLVRNDSNRRYLLYLIALVAIGLALWLIFFNIDRTKPITKPANFNTVSDSSTGLSFNMSKNFEPIPEEELAAMNPGFSYGFRSASDPKALCIVSQSRLGGRGSVSSKVLRDGILVEVKKVHLDAKLLNESTALNPVKFGEAQGLLLEIAYTEGTDSIRRVEIIALGKAFQVIAYCQSLAADNQRYYKDFTIFFSSLKLTR